MTLATLTLPSGQAHLRRAIRDDLTPLIRLLADDAISASRGDAAREQDRPAYERAFEAMQLTVIPGLSRRGAFRLQVEAVRVRSDQRGKGIGGAMIRWALDAAPGMGVRLVQLTSDAAREDAHRFYERLGFTASHVGFKCSVPAGE
jgi:GNAT superfamily N-acetyltransferase